MQRHQSTGETIIYYYECVFVLSTFRKKKKNQHTHTHTHTHSHTHTHTYTHTHTHTHTHTLWDFEADSGGEMTVLCRSPLVPYSILVAAMNLAILCRSHLGSVLYIYSGRLVAAMNLAILYRSPLVPYSINTVGD